MAVFQAAIGNVTNHFAHTFSVWACCSYTVLRFAHFADRNFFHSTGDLASIVNTPDLTFYLFTTGHDCISVSFNEWGGIATRIAYQVCVALNFSMAALNVDSIWSL